VIKRPKGLSNRFLTAVKVEAIKTNKYNSKEEDKSQETLKGILSTIKESSTKRKANINTSGSNKKVRKNPP
jgi:hypothetical protein